MATHALTMGAPSRAPSLPASSRRSFLGALAFAPVIAAPISATAGTAEGATITAPHSHALTNFDAIDAEATRLNKQGGGEVEWDAWERRALAAYRQAEALPCSPENAQIKARAIASIYCESDGERPWGEDDSTSGRLGRQIIQCLTGLEA